MIENLEDVIDERYYHVSDLKAILKNMGLSFSIFTIRDYESYKCKNFKCGKRFLNLIEKCDKCGNIDFRKPLIISPRTHGGLKGVGHRRYTGQELKEIIKLFEKRI